MPKAIMAQTKSKLKKPSTKKAHSVRRPTLHISRRFFWGLILLAALVGATTMCILQQRTIGILNKKVRQQAALMGMPNQACAGLNTINTAGLALTPTLINLTAKQTLQADADGKIATFTCTTGQNTKPAVVGKDVAAIDSEGIEMGAEVMYFDSAEHADVYHQKVINPLRYWGVPNGELMAGVPQLQYFVSYVFGDPVYFDAYAVKGNVIARVTLPCGSPDTEASQVEKCLGASIDEGAAITGLRALVGSVSSLKYY